MNTTQQKIRICAVVTGDTIEKFIENLIRIQKVADMIELRVDHIQNMQPFYLDLIKLKLYKEAILACRRKSTYGKGGFLGSIKEVNTINQYANDIGIDYIDIELREYEKSTLKNKKSKVILSYHDWEKTDTFKKLENLLEKMRQKKEDVIKIATMVNTEEDIKNLIRLLLTKRDDEKLVVIGMGEKAIFTRTFNPLLGSFLTFASVGESYSAPGQLDIKTLKAIYYLLGYNI